MGLGERRGYNILCAQRAACRSGHVWSSSRDEAWTVVGRVVRACVRGPWARMSASTREFRLTRLSFRRDVRGTRDVAVGTTDPRGLWSWGPS